MATLETRLATAEDAPIIAKLALELGYDADVPAVRFRLGQLRDEEDHAVFVAALDGKQVVGWIHLSRRCSLTSRAFIEIEGLIVASAHRRLGIGRALMDRARSWAELLQVDDIRVRAQPHRKEAHAFYERQGFSVLKEQRVYALEVPRVDVGSTPTLVD